MISAHSKKTKTSTTTHTVTGPAWVRGPRAWYTVGAVLTALQGRYPWARPCAEPRYPERCRPEWCYPEVLPGVCAGGAASTQNLDDDRHDRHEHDDDEHQLDVVAHHLELAEPEAQHRDTRGPRDTADQRVAEVALRL